MMNRRKKMIKKREAKQRKADEGRPLSRNPKQQGEPLPEGTKLIFKPGTAAIVDVWHKDPKSGDPPFSPAKQP